MTKKDYIAISQVLLHAMNREDTAEDMRQHIAKELASLLQRDNGSFDRDRFLAACGVSK